MTLEKKYKIFFFLEKKWGAYQWFYSREKASSPWKQFLFEKKFFQFFPVFSFQYFCSYDHQKGVQNFFQNKWISRCLSVTDFKVPKNCSSQ